MADVASKKSGFRAFFGKRTSNDSGPRKRLSKKGSYSQGDREKYDSEVATNPRRQDSGSFTNQIIDLPNGDDGLLHEDATDLTSDGIRDSPYSAIHPNNRPTHIHPPPAALLAEYRRNSEGQQQYNVPLYQQAQSSRSASLSKCSNAFTQNITLPALPEKSSPTNLTKAHRMLQVDDFLDKDTGERKDLTDMMHAFTFNEELDDDEETPYEASLDYDYSKPDGTEMLSGVSPEIWLRISDFMTPLDVANLSSTCRTMYIRLGQHPQKLLSDPANRPYRLDFLLAMDYKLPRHLLCFPCAQWHLRIQPGLETLKPHNILNPLFECPNRMNIHRPPPRIRISDGRMLPFTFVQLCRRSMEFGPEFGIRHQSLARRWKDPYSAWIHESMYHVTSKGHVMMRVKSQHYVEAGMGAAAKRLLLFNRADFIPYFSVCAHWKHGILTSIPKCALDHIPVASQYAVAQLREKVAGHKAIGSVSLCNRCRPMRRCPECPTEYLFELKLVEDKTVRAQSPERFKQALVVTRWSDLGPGRSPDDDEWAAIVGESDKYDSLHEIGRRAVSGVFESAFTDTIPGQRILSSNPKKLTEDEIGGDWY
ncbi:hypothetical protein GQ44DRAFT_740568 [Phaeosphaeriaceae sp. PMI808]|nr:hypothetical protein GQ44DRAFT_740568 [Phaeosphaeriaceae sp. PMI808]